MGTEERIVAIVGATASGKSAMAMALAQKYQGEIICADSRTIYKDMDIGTAKPSQIDQRLIPHHCLNMILPSEVYNVADFQTVANRAVKDIHARGKMPFIVGGSGLYIDAVLYSYTFEEMEEYPKLRDLSLAELQDIADKRRLNPTPNTYSNARHLAGYIARNGQSSKATLPESTILIGIDVDKELLEARITQRVEDMFAGGFVAEVEKLMNKYGSDAPGFAAPGYKPVIQYLRGEISLDEAKLLFIQRDKQLAKRQLTWFKRNKDIHWVQTLVEAEQIIDEKR